MRRRPAPRLLDMRPPEPRGMLGGRAIFACVSFFAVVYLLFVAAFLLGWISVGT